VNEPELPTEPFSDTGHLRGFDVAVIGAGPAGMAAAATAADRGLRVALIDAGPQLGGQYFRHPAPGLTAPWLPKLYHGWQHFEQLVTRVETASGIEVLFGHQVWAVEPGFKVLTDRGPVEAPYVILATGAYERVVPFPGWDLPGVFTAGGAQALLKGNLVLPGRRVVVAGTGPLLLPVATGLATAGAKVLALYEANNIRGYAKNPLPLLSNPTKLAEGLDYARQLTRARIPVHTGRMIIEAQGADALEAVVAARPDGTDPQRIRCDSLAIGYGLAPQIDLALTLGAATTHLSDGTIALRVNTTQRTTIPGLYAAGEAAGVAGAETALLEGEIAGLAVAQAAARARRVADRAAGIATPTPDTPPPSENAPSTTPEDKPASPITSRAIAAARARVTCRTADGHAAGSDTAGSEPAPTEGKSAARVRARFARRTSPSPDSPAASSSAPAPTEGKSAGRVRARFARRASPSPDSPAASSSVPAPAEGKSAARVRARLSRRTSPSPDSPAASSSAPAPTEGKSAARVLARLARRASPSPDTPESASAERPPARPSSAEATSTGSLTARAVTAARSRLPQRASEPPAAEPLAADQLPADQLPTEPLAPTTLPSLPTLLRRRTRQRALADLLRARHPIPDAWRDHLAADTLVCRCEEVPASAVAEAVTDLGAADSRTVKLLTRAGMGWCQGRVCGYAVACLARRSGEAPTEADLLAAAKRPLARPVPLSVIAEQDQRNQ